MLFSEFCHTWIARVETQSLTEKELERAKMLHKNSYLNILTNYTDCLVHENGLCM